MSEDKEILWNYYQEEMKQAINHESSRASITNMILIIAGVIISIVTYDDSIELNDIPHTVFLIIIGLFGIIFNIKYYERYSFHYSRSKGYRILLEEKFSNIDFNSSREKSNTENLSRFKIISKVRLNWLWLILNSMISVFGLVLTLKILLK